MNYLIHVFVLSANVLCQSPPECLVEHETYAVAGLSIGERLSYRFGARHVCGKGLNPTSTLE